MISSLAQVWRLALVCALRPGGRFGILIFAAVFALGLVGIQITVRLIRWTNDFYNALQRLDVPEAVHQIGVFFVLVAISATLHLAAAWLRKLLQIRWRRVLTDHVLDTWLAGRAYWHMRDKVGNGLDNPDQRIADDCRIYVYRLTTEALEFVTAIVALFTYVSILWSLSTFPLGFTLFGIDLSVPRYMVWAAPLYVAISSGITHWLGAPLVPLNFQQQKAEADFRFALARFRQHGEQVALSGGEAAERRRFDARFAAIAGNWLQLMNRDLILGCFTRPYMQTVLRIPLFLALPAFLAGKLTFGGLMQIGSAFQNVVTTLSWFIFSYRDLAELFATADRLDTFLGTAGAARDPAGGPERMRDTMIATRAVAIETPAGAPVLAPPDFAVRPGEVVWLRGPSGLGKTTLTRLMAGLWPHGSGWIGLPAGRTMILPQQAYLPLGSIAEAAAYPAGPDTVPEAAIRAALETVGLARLAADDGLGGDVQATSLSGGERQRLVLARLLVHRPDWIVLDEATSALDEAAEAEVLGALRRALPRAAFVVIAHRAPQGLGDPRIVDLAARPSGPAPVTAAAATTAAT